jgi:hypothetical protein
VDPRASLDDVEKILDPIGTRNLTVLLQPVASPYTDSAPPYPVHEKVKQNLPLRMTFYDEKSDEL